MSKNRRKMEAENRARLDRHSNEKALATRQANHQREVALGRERLEGLFPVRMPSLLEEMDSHEVTSRGGGVVSTAVASRGAAAPAFIPPRFQPSLVREIETVTQPYISPNRLTLKRIETVDPKTGKKSGKFAIRGLKLPPDVARRLVDRVDGLVLEVELNDDGILFRPASAQPSAVSLPSWVPIKK